MRIPARLTEPPGPRPLGTAFKPLVLRPTILPETMVLTVLCPKSQMPVPLLPDTTLPAMTLGLAITVSADCNQACSAATPAKPCGSVASRDDRLGTAAGTGTVPLIEMPAPELASLALEPESAAGLVPMRLPVTV